VIGFAKDLSLPQRQLVNPRLPLAAACAVLALLTVGCAAGTYRMPYADGTVVEVYKDFVTHSSPKAYMYDIIAQNGSPPEIVAAAPGRVRFIQDHKGISQCSCGGPNPACRNNYVWIEHTDPEYSHRCDQGTCSEWTIYAHLQQGSVTGAAGLSVGDWVKAGDLLGYEGDIGCADVGDHLHWMVAVLPPLIAPSSNGDYEGFVNSSGERPELIPIVCHRNGAHVLWRDATYTAAGCPAPLVGSVRESSRLPTRGPIAAFVQQVSRISDEAIRIAQAEADPELMERTQQLVVRLDPAALDLLRLGRARVSAVELHLALKLITDYETRASGEMRSVLASVRRQLELPDERARLGLEVDPPFEGLD
jgi:murein DD-endopeptidase MepM/ murein hydrolase activator NlpD